jgi:hypothetical protein
MSLAPLSAAIGSAPGPGSHAGPGGRAASGTQLASLNDQIRRDKQQLNDWTTCVSAKTTKGHAEIQRLSADLAGAQSRAHRLSTASPDATSTSPSHLIDVWA